MLFLQEQRMKAKIERREGKVNVEGRATQRGVSAYTTWSIEKEGVQHRPIPHVAAQNHVRNFRAFCSRFRRICNSPELSVGICKATMTGLQIPILPTCGLQIRPNKEGSPSRRPPRMEEAPSRRPPRMEEAPYLPPSRGRGLRGGSPPLVGEGNRRESLPLPWVRWW